MSLSMGSRKIARNSILVLASMAISVFAWGQHKEESKGSAPHESRPSGQSHASRPSGGGGGGQSRPSGPSHASGPNQGRPAGARPEGPGGNRPAGNPNRSGNGNGPRGGNPSGNRPGNINGNRAGNPGGNRGENAPRGDTINRGNFSRGGAGNAASSPKFTAPGRNVSLRGGGSASIRPNGQVRSINRNGMQIQQNIHGGRTIVTERNGTRIVNTPGGGYVQRSYMVHGGSTYYSRTYYSGGVYRVGLYRGYYYGGYRYYGYYPGFWYHPGFYGWAYRPWGAPVYWGVGLGGWGWAGSPWWGFYGGWWAPYPYYASPAFWLTGYLIAQSLQDSYAAQYATANSAGGYDQGASNQGPSGPSNYSDQGQASNSGPVQLTPEVKEAIAEEVKAQLAEQQQQAPAGGDAQDQAPAPAPTNQVPPALDPARRTFVVHNEITVVSDGKECELTGGDVLTRLTDTPDANQMVTASVAASKKSECAAGSQVAVSVDALQEMHNHFEEQLNNGLKTLAEKQGTGGLPKAPDTSTVASPVPTPQPDQNASKELADQQAQADQTESQVKQEAAGPGGGNQ
jgi:hypothetical protein